MVTNFPKKFLSLVGVSIILYGIWWYVYLDSSTAFVLNRPSILNVPVSVATTLQSMLNTTTIKRTTASIPATTPNSINIFYEMQDFIASIPRRPEAKVFANISNILSHPWKHNEARSKYFKLKFETETNMSTSQHIMLTQENTPLDSLMKRSYRVLQ
ncbi:uncharacterized protein [Amphiura filiformis]|uniref:uncharacterized protein isoform X2 n=1 Tax=Amphiura filiformis TaxID=82378 RepID=UPI003B2260DA